MGGVGGVGGVGSSPLALRRLSHSNRFGYLTKAMLKCEKYISLHLLVEYLHHNCFHLFFVPLCEVQVRESRRSVGFGGFG